MAVKKRADRQMTGVAGEFFVAAELSKRGLHTAPTPVITEIKRVIVDPKAVAEAQTAVVSAVDPVRTTHYAQPSTTGHH